VARGKWWEIFQDPQLNALEEQINVSNEHLKAAEAQFRQARALVRFNRAAYYPTVTAGASAAREHLSEHRPLVSTTAQTNVTDFVIPVDVSYEADVFGRVRRTVEAARSNAQASAGDLESVRLSMHAELALDYFQMRTLDAEEQLLRSNVTSFERALELTKSRYTGGVASAVDVAQAQTLLEGARAQSIDVSLQRAQAEHAIAVLIGEMPAALAIDTTPINGEPPRLPPEMPSRLLERRPDIAAAERRVAAANSQIGVATSAFFPTLGISASVGLQTTTLQKLLSWPAGFWSVGPTLAYQLFDGGARRAVKAGAVAAYDVTIGAYRETVLGAFQDVEDNLAAQRLLAEEFDHQQLAVTAAQQALDISLNQYRAGLISYLQVAIEQAQLLNNQRSALSITGRRYGAAVGLIRALGGGWDGRLDDGAAPAPGATPAQAPATPPAQ